MRGVDVAFEALQPVAVAHVAHDDALVVGDAQHLERRQRRRHLALAHVDPDDAALLGDLVGLGLDAVGEALVLGQVRLVEAVAFDVELPAVIDAAQAAFLVAAEEHRGAAVRAAVIEDADAALGVAEGDQLLAQELDAHRRGVGLELAAAGRPGSSIRASARPVGVPGPTRVRMSLCSIDSIRHSSSISYGVRTLVRLYRDEAGRRLDSHTSCRRTNGPRRRRRAWPWSWP